VDLTTENPHGNRTNRNTEPITNTPAKMLLCLFRRAMPAPATLMHDNTPLHYAPDKTTVFIHDFFNQRSAKRCGVFRQWWRFKKSVPIKINKVAAVFFKYYH
jgi:hypothetical protein